MDIVDRHIGAHGHAQHCSDDLWALLLVEAGDDANRIERAVAEMAHRRVVRCPLLDEVRLRAGHAPQAVEQAPYAELLPVPVLVYATSEVVPTFRSTPAPAAHRLHEQIRF